MSKLGTHPTKTWPRKAFIRETARRGLVCAVCDAPTVTACERCHAWLCLSHTTHVPRMYWDTTWIWAPYMPMSYPVAPLKHYMPAGRWRVCDACRHIISSRQAREIAIDRTTTFHRRIESALEVTLLIAAVLVSAVISILVLIGYLHGTPVPPHNGPYIGAP